jgi:ankyrin repeat protein
MFVLAIQAGWTALHDACFAGHLDCVKLLISEGADASCLNSVSFCAHDVHDCVAWLEHLAFFSSAVLIKY